MATAWSDGATLDCAIAYNILLHQRDQALSIICVQRSRSISRGSRCSVNELEGTVGIRIPTTSAVATGAREDPAGPVRNCPHCDTLTPGDVVLTTLRDIGSITTPDNQQLSVAMISYQVDPTSSYMLFSKIKPCMSKYIPLHPTSRSDPSQSVQSPATCVESIRDALCIRGFLIDVAFHVSRPHLDHCKLSYGICQHSSCHFRRGSRTEVATLKYRNGTGTTSTSYFQRGILPWFCQH